MTSKAADARKLYRFRSVYCSKLEFLEFFDGNSDALDPASGVANHASILRVVKFSRPRNEQVSKWEKNIKELRTLFMWKELQQFQLDLCRYYDCEAENCREHLFDYAAYLKGEDEELP